MCGQSWGAAGWQASLVLGVGSILCSKLLGFEDLSSGGHGLGLGSRLDLGLDLQGVERLLLALTGSGLQKI